MNIDDNEERMRKKKEGDTLGEKIENFLEKLKKKEVSQLVTDSFYELTYESGIPFQVRKTNTLKDMTFSKKIKVEAEPKEEGKEEVKEEGKEDKKEGEEGEAAEK